MTNTTLNTLSRIYCADSAEQKRQHLQELDDSTRNSLYDCIRVLTGVPPRVGNQWSERHLFDNMQRLSNAITVVATEHFHNLSNEEQTATPQTEGTLAEAILKRDQFINETDAWANETLPDGRAIAAQRIKRAYDNIDESGLDLSKLALLSLPSTIGNLSELKRLDLRGNQLAMLPPEIGNLSVLLQSNLENNRLAVLPP